MIYKESTGNGIVYYRNNSAEFDYCLFQLLLYTRYELQMVRSRRI